MTVRYPLVLNGTSIEELQSGDTLAGTSAFDSGTALLFVQTAAPTGWTKSTTHNDKALRVVSGSASSGGSTAFSSTFNNSNSAGATTLSTAQMPSHTHTIIYNGGSATGLTSGNVVNANFNTQSGSAGGGGSHTHSLSLAVQYVDVIIATKD